MQPTSFNDADQEEEKESLLSLFKRVLFRLISCLRTEVDK